MMCLNYVVNGMKMLQKEILPTTETEKLMLKPPLELAHPNLAGPIGYNVIHTIC